MVQIEPFLLLRSYSIEKWNPVIWRVYLNFVYLQPSEAGPKFNIRRSTRRSQGVSGTRYDSSTTNQSFQNTKSIEVFVQICLCVVIVWHRIILTSSGVTFKSTCLCTCSFKFRSLKSISYSKLSRYVQDFGLKNQIQADFETFTNS